MAPRGTAHRAVICTIAVTWDSDFQYLYDYTSLKMGICLNGVASRPTLSSETEREDELNDRRITSEADFGRTQKCAG
jgi:hypothetical protein